MGFEWLQLFDSTEIEIRYSESYTTIPILTNELMMG